MERFKILVLIRVILPLKDSLFSMWLAFFQLVTVSHSDKYNQRSRPDTILTNHDTYTDQVMQIPAILTLFSINVLV